MASPQALVEDHAWLPRALVAKRFRTVPRHVDRDDLRGVAALALAQAAHSWDGRGTFGGYAWQRATWAVQDYLRTLHNDWSLDWRDDGPDWGRRPEELATVRVAWSRLPRQHRDVLAHLVLDDRPATELAARWGVSQARVSQMKAEALMRMRTEVA